MAGRDRPDNCAGPLTVLFQMIKRQGEYLIRRKPCAILVNNAKAIGIAVQAQPDLSFPAAHKAADLSHSFCIGFGMMATE